MSEQTSEPIVLLDYRDEIAIITLNRPERRNGVTLELCERLYDAVREVAASRARVVILRGAGENFCVGADMTATFGGSERKIPDRLDRFYHAATLLHTMPQVTIAAIDGGCAGAGLGWATACDLRFATAEARFNTAFLAVGVSTDMGMPWFLNRILGGAKARELLFFPEKMTGEQARDIGLVTRLFARDALHDEVLALAAQLCGRDAFALEAIKANLLSAETLNIGEFIEIEASRQIQTTNRPNLSASMAAAHAKSKG